MSKNNLTLFVLFGLLVMSSCSIFIKYSPDEMKSKNYIRKNLHKDIMLPVQKGPIFFINHESAQSLKQIQVLIQEKSDLKDDVVDLFYLWAMTQMYSRPDQNSPTARLQIVIRKKGVYSFFDFRDSVLFRHYNFLMKNPQYTQAIKSSKENERELKKSIKEYWNQVDSYLKKRTKDQLNNKEYALAAIDDVQDIEDIPEIDKIEVQEMDKTKSFPNFTPMPYLFGLNYLKKHFSQKDNLDELNKILKNYFQQNSSVVTPALSLFLQRFKEELQNHHLFKQLYFNEDDPIFVHEQLPVFSLEKVLDIYKGNHLNKSTALFYNVKQQLFDQDKGIVCTLNKAPQLAKNDSNTFGVILDNADRDFILANATQNVSNLQPFFQTSLVSGNSNSPGLDYCVTKNWITFGINDLASKAILYNMFAPGRFSMDKINNAADLQNFTLISPRYLVLDDPKRIVLETQLLTDSQLNEVSLVGPTIYSKLEMGELWSIFHFPATGEAGLLLDPRTNPSIRALFH